MVTANDADKNKTLVYSMEGMPDIVKMVYLDRESGDITVASKIDHESYTWLNLTVSILVECCRGGWIDQKSIFDRDYLYDQFKRD